VLHGAVLQPSPSEDLLTPDILSGAIQEIAMTIAIIVLPVLSLIAMDWILRLQQPQ
jgi:hypothetical protein